MFRLSVWIFVPWWSICYNRLWCPSHPLTLLCFNAYLSWLRGYTPTSLEKSWINGIASSRHGRVAMPLHEKSWIDGIASSRHGCVAMPLHEKLWIDGIASSRHGCVAMPLHEKSWIDGIASLRHGCMAMPLHETCGCMVMPPHVSSISWLCGDAPHVSSKLWIDGIASSRRGYVAMPPLVSSSDKRTSRRTSRLSVCLVLYYCQTYRTQTFEEQVWHWLTLSSKSSVFKNRFCFPPIVGISLYGWTCSQFFFSFKTESQ